MRIVIFWIGMNLFLNFFNRWLFTETSFKFPYTLTMIQMLITFLSSLPLFAFKVVPFKKVNEKKVYLSLFVLAFCTAFNIGFNNASLVFIDVSMNQIIRSLLPALTILLGGVLLKKKYSKNTILIIGFLITSAIFAMYKSPTYHNWGVFLAVLSLLASGVWTILSFFTLAEKIKLDPLNLQFYLSLPIIVILSIPAMAFEWSQVDGVPSILSQATPQLYFYLFLSGIMAFVYNFSHFMMLKTVGPLSSTVLGNLKVAILIFISIGYFHIEMMWWNYLGAFMIVFFSFLYSFEQNPKLLQGYRLRFEKRSRYANVLR